MFQPWTLFTAWRYLTSKRQHGFANFVSAVSLLGIALGVAALIIVLSVMNGFEREVTRHVLGMSAHGLLVPTNGYIEDWRSMKQAAEQFDGVVAGAPYVRGSGMPSRKGEARGVSNHGIVTSMQTAVSETENYLDSVQFNVLR